MARYARQFGSIMTILTFFTSSVITYAHVTSLPVPAVVLTATMGTPGRADLRTPQ